uniref:uncharacterized protein LOC131139936 n=1 Tax=Doryrhamphus excisus TaxID=161450 RepID=UPI0025ADD448|nr:uncharacterized protein LOC131139936 [Doryrhamphus excisus]
MKGSVRSALLVADQPLAEEGLLAIRRRNHPQHQNHGVLQQNADLLKYDKEEYDGGERLIRESALEKFPQVRETSEESISNEFEEKGSGYEVDNLKEEQEGQNAGQLGQVNPTKGEALHECLQPEQMLASQVTEQGDVQHYDAKGDEEKRNRTNGTEEAARTKFSEVHNNDEQGDDKDLIWYFSWRCPDELGMHGGQVISI